MPAKIIDLLRQRRDELVALEPQWPNWSKITEWHARTRPLIVQFFPEQLDQFDEFIKPKWVAFPRVYSLSSRSRNDNSGLDAAERRANDGLTKSGGMIECCG